MIDTLRLKDALKEQFLFPLFNNDGNKGKSLNINNYTSTPLPQDWTWRSIKNASTFLKRGKSPKYADEGTVKVLSQKCVQWEGLHPELSRLIDEESIKKYSPDYYIKSGDILWNSTGTGTIGRTAVFKRIDDNGQIFVVDSHLTVIRLNPKIVLPEYLNLFLTSRIIQSAIEELASGSTNQLELSRKKIESLLFPLPPLEEQKRIVAKIEELFAKIDEIDKAQKELKELAKLAEKKVLDMAVHGELTSRLVSDSHVEDLFSKKSKTKQYCLDFEKLDKIRKIPANWRYAGIQQIGTSSLGKTLNSSKDSGIQKTYLCSINVQEDYISFEEVKTARFSEKELDKYRLHTGDLLICEGGDVGRSAIWADNREMYYQNALHRFTPNPGIYSEYIQLVFSFYKKAGILERYARGQTIKHLVQSSLYSIPLPIPPAEEQKRITEKCKRLISLVNSILL